MHRHLSFFAIFLLFIYSFFIFFRPLGIDDLWTHLNMGQWIFQHKQVPYQDPFPYTHEKNPMIFQEWMGSLFIFLIYKSFGYLGLNIFRSLIFLLVLGIFLKYAFRRIPGSSLIFLGLLMIWGLSNRAGLRPDMFNFIFIQIFLINLFSYERNHNGRQLILLPILGWIWANLHFGSWAYGLLIIIMFLISSIVKLFTSPLKMKKQASQLGMLVFIYSSIFLFTPYGVDGFLYPFKSLLLPNHVNLYSYMNSVGEHLPPGYMFLSLNYVYLLILFFLALTAITSNRKTAFTSTLILMISTAMFLLMSRNVSFFVIASIYVIVELTQNWKKENNLWWPKTIERYALLTLIVFLSFLISCSLNENIYYKNQAIKTVTLDIAPQIVATMDTFKRNQLQGPVFNINIMGGPLLWFNGTLVHPFMNGHLLDQEKFNNTNAIMVNPEKFWPINEERYGFTSAILRWNVEFKLAYYLSHNLSWQLIAIHGPFLIYVKKEIFHLPKKIDNFEQQLRLTTASFDDLKTLAYLNEHNQNIFQNLFNDSRNDLVDEAAGMFVLGYQGAAIKTLIKTQKIGRNSYTHKITSQIISQLFMDSFRNPASKR